MHHVPFYIRLQRNIETKIVLKRKSDTSDSYQSLSNQWTDFDLSMIRIKPASIFLPSLHINKAVIILYLFFP